MITIIDYGMGNLGSIVNMLKRIGEKNIVSKDIEDIKTAQKILLPGVGAFDAAMHQIQASGLREALEQKVLEDGIPLLGICLGMQLLTRRSEEGTVQGLGWIDAETKRFPMLPNLKIPHMGWNQVIPKTSSSFTKELPAESRFYFAHSYYVQVDDPRHTILQSSYGIEFSSAIQRDNIYGVQFHPEKSHKFGMSLLKSFAAL